MEKRTVNFKVNGNTVELVIEPTCTLLDVLREHMDLTGTKRGCGVGACGACTVIIDGEAENACQIEIQELEGKEVQTVEGLSNEGKLDTLQTMFVKHNAVQCGFCTPGFLMRSKAYLDHHSEPSEKDIREALAGHICRCSDYSNIIEAVRHTVSERSKKSY